jgi:hypothetical protein
VVDQGVSRPIGVETPRRSAVYCKNCDIAVALPGDSPDPLVVRPWAMDPALADRLYSLNEEPTSVPL